VVARGVVFDMDDTLYLERDYVRSGFRAVARHVADAADADAIFASLWGWFEAGVRGDTFDRLLARFPDVAARFDIATLVAAYRGHTPDIDLLPAMRELLAGLRERGVRLGVLSDGPLPAQRAKALALGLDRLVDAVLLTDELGRDGWKPSTRGFEVLAERMGLAHNELVYVGDNPVKDFIAPRKLGWRAIRLRMAGQLHAADEPADEAGAPHAEVSDPAGLYNALA